MKRNSASNSPRGMVILIAGMLAACGGGGGGGRGGYYFWSDDGGTDHPGGSDGFVSKPDLAPGPDLAMAAYPAGPYGNQAGETLANLAFEGYRLTPVDTDSSLLTWDKTIRLGDFHANPKCKCLLI